MTRFPSIILFTGQSQRFEVAMVSAQRSLDGAAELAKQLESESHARAEAAKAKRAAANEAKRAAPQLPQIA